MRLTLFLLLLLLLGVSRGVRTTLLVVILALLVLDLVGLLVLLLVLNLEVLDLGNSDWRHDYTLVVSAGYAREDVGQRVISQCLNSCLLRRVLSSSRSLTYRE